ncbi:MAG: GGDEF domain-containing protein [Comamonas sp.]
MGSAFSHFLFGTHSFGEHAPLQEFQHRFLVCSLLVCAGCSTAYVLLTLPMEVPNGRWLRSTWLLLAAAVLTLWQWLRAHPEHFRRVAWTLMVLDLCVLGASMWLNPLNPLIFLWLFSTILPAFVLLGRPAGWVLAVLTMGLTLLANRLVHQSFPAIAMYTTVGATLCMALQCHFYMARFQSFFTRLQEYNAHLRQLAQYDPLTGVRNAAAYYAQCDQHIRLAQRSGRGFAVLFADLDHFKQINDTHGHAAGDAVLRTVAQRLLQTVRDSDVVGRVGGEEFSILLPDTDCQGAMDLAERIRAAIESLHVQLESRICLHVTASLGVSICQDATQDIQSIQREADHAMYQAKTGGRNRVSLFGSQPLPEVG